ncbi:MAG: tetratricopeptide repeat protein [Acidobacteriota bacterium]|nr:tetratricopeptide repeat protein [Acidobacteriota bacterium]
MPAGFHRCRAAAILVVIVVALVSSSVVAAADVASIYREGTRLLKEDDFAGALQLFERARELDPGSSKIWVKIGLARAGLGDTEGAMEAYRRAADLDPGNVKALNNAANVYYRQGRYDEAAEWYLKALEIDPDYILAGYHYGWILRHENRLEEAEKMFTHVVQQQPANDRDRRTQIEALYFLGAISFRNGAFERTATIMERVIAAIPNHPEARYYLAMAYRSIGRDEEAREQLEIHKEITRSVHRERPVEKKSPS